MTWTEFLIFAGVFICFGGAVGYGLAFMAFSARSAAMEEREADAFNAGWEGGADHVRRQHAARMSPEP